MEKKRKELKKAEQNGKDEEHQREWKTAEIMKNGIEWKE